MLGEVPATGRDVDRQIIDVLTVEDGLITDVRVVGDDLGLLARLGVVSLV